MPADRIGLRPREAAEALGFSLRHLVDLEASGELGPAPRRLGRVVLYDRAELAAWLANPGPDGKLLDRVQWTKLRKAKGSGPRQP